VSYTLSNSVVTLVSSPCMQPWSLAGANCTGGRVQHGPEVCVTVEIQPHHLVGIVARKSVAVQFETKSRASSARSVVRFRGMGILPMVGVFTQVDGTRSTSTRAKRSSIQPSRHCCAGTDIRGLPPIRRGVPRPMGRMPMPRPGLNNGGDWPRFCCPFKLTHYPEIGERPAPARANRRIFSQTRRGLIH
jgi:hypothetical protein